MNRQTISFDSRLGLFRSPFGAVPAGAAVTFRIVLPVESGAREPRLLVYEADQWDRPVLAQPMKIVSDELSAAWYETVFTPPAPRLLFYQFDAQTDSGRVPIRRGPGSAGFLGNWDGDFWQLTVYDPAMKTPPALAGGILYQIFPDRFRSSGAPKRNVPSDRILRGDWGGTPEWKPDADGKTLCNDYFGGDLAGIRERLPYLASLGVTALYLNPIFEAHSNHRYNTADYRKIDPLLGDEADFAALCADAHALGISVLLDGVFSHTGSDSLYFNREGRYGPGGAFRDPGSPYRSWYQFDPSDPARYKSWWGFETLPEVNETDPSYLAFLCGEGGVIEHWMQLGADGFRLDVADELPDPALDAICAAIRRSNPNAPVIGEVWEDASNKISYGVRRRYLLGGQLSSVMNYPLRAAILGFVRDGDAGGLWRTLCSLMEHYPPPVLHGLMNPLSTHDVARALTALAAPSEEGASRAWQAAHNALSAEALRSGKRLLRLAAVLQYLLPGTPSLYYGDEAGLFGYRDPFNRGCFPWDAPDEGLTAFFRELGALRRSHPFLASASLRFVEATPDVFSFVRAGDGEGERLFAAVNRSASPRTPRLPAGVEPSRMEVLFGSGTPLALPGYGFLVMRF